MKASTALVLAEMLLIVLTLGVAEPQGDETHRPPYWSCPICPQPNCPKPVCPPPPVCPDRLRPTPPPTPLPTPRTTPPPVSSVSTNVSCSSCLWRVLTTYDHFPGVGYYKAYKTPVNWHQAKELCEGDGAHLGIINSEKEAEIFRLLYSKDGMSFFVFIGFHDLNHEGHHETIFGEPISKTGYTGWISGQPDNAGNEDCGTINHLAMLNDGRCDWKTGFICEVSEEKAIGK